MVTYAVAYFIGGDYDTHIPYLTFERYNASMSIVPNLTTASFVPGSNDTQIVYNLVSSNLKWSDGVPINASDLYFSFDQFFPQGKYANTTTDLLTRVSQFAQSVQILNSTAVTVTLKGPTPEARLLFVNHPVFPEHYYVSF
jgi:ABC-type transport system substrate-binding protein